MCKKQGGTLPYALLILLQSVLYGFGNPLSKIGFESITVLWCLGIRFSGAAALVFSERSLPGIDPISMAAAQAAVTGVLCLAALIFDDVAVLPQGTVTGWLVVAYLALLCTCLSYLLLGGEAVGDRTGGSGAYRGLRGAGKLAERPKANRIRIRGRSFLNVLLFSYKETFAVEIGRFLTNRNVRRGIILCIQKIFRILDMWKLNKIIR